MNKQSRGFTLIELLIVVVIIGILAAIAIPKFSSTREKAFISSLKSDLKNLATLQEVYHNNHYTYSTAPRALQFGESDGVTVAIGEGTGSGWSATAVHAGFPGESCSMYHGSATPVTPATVESTVMCSR